MYCVIQQVMRKKPSPYGEPLEIIAYQNQWRLDVSKPFTWAWEYSKERYARPTWKHIKLPFTVAIGRAGWSKNGNMQYAPCPITMSVKHGGAIVSVVERVL